MSLGHVGGFYHLAQGQAHSKPGVGAPRGAGAGQSLGGSSGTGPEGVPPTTPSTVSAGEGLAVSLASGASGAWEAPSSTRLEALPPLFGR